MDSSLSQHLVMRLRKSGLPCADVSYMMYNCFLELCYYKNEGGFSIRECLPWPRVIPVNKEKLVTSQPIDL